jgi:hypothetical protein
MMCSPVEQQVCVWRFPENPKRHFRDASDPDPTAAADLIWEGQKRCSRGAPAAGFVAEPDMNRGFGLSSSSPR